MLLWRKRHQQTVSGLIPFALFFHPALTSQSYQPLLSVNVSLLLCISSHLIKDEIRREAPHFFTFRSSGGGSSHLMCSDGRWLPKEGSMAVTIHMILPVSTLAHCVVT